MYYNRSTYWAIDTLHMWQDATRHLDIIPCATFLDSRTSKRKYPQTTLRWFIWIKEPQNGYISKQHRFFFLLWNHKTAISAKTIHRFFFLPTDHKNGYILQQLYITFLESTTTERSYLQTTIYRFFGLKNHKRIYLHKLYIDFLYQRTTKHTYEYIRKQLYVTFLYSRTTKRIYPQTTLHHFLE